MVASALRSLFGGSTVRRAIIALVLSLCLLGCGAAAGLVATAGPVLTTGEPVDLLTGVDGCYAGGETGGGGLLLIDPEYGTRIGDVPVMWPVGFTGVRAGGEVTVLNAAGKLVATTGRTYHMSIGYVGTDKSRKLMQSLNAFPAAADCPYPWDFIDCTAAASATGELTNADGTYTALGEAKLYCR